MDIKQQINDFNTNYCEYILYDTIIMNEHDKIYKTSLNEELFNTHKMKFYNLYKNNKKQIQYFTKTYKVYNDNNIEYSIFNDNERSITIYEKQLHFHMCDNNLTNIQQNKNNTVDEPILFNNNLFDSNYYINNYVKKNLTHSLFNWNDDLHNIYNVNRLTFMFKDKSGHHKLYINFDKLIYDNDETSYYNIYVNFNYNKLGDFNKKYELFSELCTLMI